jgi:hypothetical protein
MAYTTTQLITRAYYLSGVVSKDLQSVSGSQLTEGLFLLNALLDTKTANQRLIPYFNKYEFDAVEEQEKYEIPNLVEAECLTFHIGDVRYSMKPQSRVDYMGSARVNNVQSLPYYWHIERTKDGADLYMYFVPNADYPCELWGKFSLQNVALGQDLSETYPMFYLEYLRYALAEYICQEYNITFPPQNAMKLNEFEQIIIDISPTDYTMQKLSSLQLENGFNWGDVNIGRGWRPS